MWVFLDTPPNMAAVVWRIIRERKAGVISARPERVRRTFQCGAGNHPQDLRSPQALCVGGNGAPATAVRLSKVA